MSEQFRHECEIKYWWAQTVGDAKKIKALLNRLEKEEKRSAAGIEKLRAGLLEIYRREHG